MPMQDVGLLSVWTEISWAVNSVYYTEPAVLIRYFHSNTNRALNSTSTRDIISEYEGQNNTL